MLDSAVNDTDLLKAYRKIPPDVLELCRGLEEETSWDGNPWIRPPSTVLESGVESALGWWADVRRFGEGKSNKLKMVFVGLAEAGKTTIVRHLTGRSAPKRCDRTVGVEITPNWRPMDGGPLQVSMWDFAGQADYYASHQLFLTKGALFLLVVDLRAFSKEVENGVNNFTDRRGRVFWWLDNLYMRVPGAAIALVGSHVDLMSGADADRAGTHLHTVVRTYIQRKAENASTGRSSRTVDTESPTMAEANHLRDGAEGFPLRGRPIQRSGSSKAPADPLVLHAHVFKVSRVPKSVLELQQWIVKAASGQDCPKEFHFPAVNQTVPKAWIEAYDAMDILKKRAPYALWGNAVKEFSKKMSGRQLEAGDVDKVLLRAMQHREAEGGVLLSMANASAPVATDMLHLDPSWLVELVRRLVDHNLVDMDKNKQGTIEEEVQEYAKLKRLKSWEIMDMHRAYCKTGQLNRDYLRFLWMHRKIDPQREALAMTSSEFESVVSTMTRLLVMYESRRADKSVVPTRLVVPARLPEYGNQRIMDPDGGTMEETIVKMQCSFGQIYPPPGLIGRFIAWSMEKIVPTKECWQRAAFFGYNHQWARYEAFLYESQYEQPHADGTTRTFAGLTLGVQGTPQHAPLVLQELKKSLIALVEDQALGYPGLGNVLYFSEEKIVRSTSLLDLRVLLENIRDDIGAMKNKLGGVVSQLLEQPLLVASNEQGEYPRLVLLRPEQQSEEDDTYERFQRAGWDRWKRALNSLHDVGLHHKFRLHFLCEHDLSEVPCGPEGRGFPIEDLKDWVKRCMPLLQVSLWILRVAVGTVSNVDLPLHDVLEAFVEATGAELVDEMGKVPDRMTSDSPPVFCGEAAENERDRSKRLRGEGYEAMCKFVREMESSNPQSWSGCLSCLRAPIIVDWRDYMVQVRNPRTRSYAWVLKANEEAYLREHGGTPATALS